MSVMKIKDEIAGTRMVFTKEQWMKAINDAEIGDSIIFYEYPAKRARRMCGIGQNIMTRSTEGRENDYFEHRHGERG